MNTTPDRNQRKALGKGLSALLPARSAPVAESNGAAAAPQLEETRNAALPPQFEDFQNIPLSQLSASEEQPRTSFDQQKLAELAQSIRVNGVIQPITVQKIGPEKYRIIAGERRYQAASLAGLNEIPALVRTAEQSERLEIALIENIQREDLNPIDIAVAFRRLADEHGLSHDEIADRTGKDRSTVTNLLRLLNLSPAVRQEVQRGNLSAGHARALLNITDEREQLRLCQEVVSKQLSVRATEDLVRQITDKRDKPAKASETQDRLDPNIKAALAELEAALGTKVRLTQKANGAGKLEIEFYSPDDLDRIYSAIVKQ